MRAIFAASLALLALPGCQPYGYGYGYSYGQPYGAAVSEPGYYAPPPAVYAPGVVYEGRERDYGRGDYGRGDYGRGREEYRGREESRDRGRYEERQRQAAPTVYPGASRPAPTVIPGSARPSPPPPAITRQRNDPLANDTGPRG